MGFNSGFKGLRYPSYRETRLFMCQSKKLSAKHFSQSGTTSWISDRDTSGKYLCNSEIVNCLYSWVFFFIRFLFHLRDQRRVPTSFLVMHISPVVFTQLPTLPHTFLVHCTFPYTPQLTACEFPPDEHFLASENSITLHVAGFSIFAFSFRYYSEWGKNL